MVKCARNLVLFLDLPHLVHPIHVACGVEGLGTRLVTCISVVQAFATRWQCDSEWPRSTNLLRGHLISPNDCELSALGRGDQTINSYFHPSRFLITVMNTSLVRCKRPLLVGRVSSILIFGHLTKWSYRLCSSHPQWLLYLPLATQSSSDVTDFSEVNSTPLGM